MSPSMLPVERPFPPANVMRRRDDAEVSVLMAASGETAENLKQSLESVYAQTVRAKQVVLVLYGAPDPMKEHVVERFALDSRIADLKIIRLESCDGFAKALNVGLEICYGAYIMFADGYSVSQPDRLELQLSYFLNHPETDVVGSWGVECDGTRHLSKVSSVDSATVIKALRVRNVLSHPTLMIATDTLRRVGGYRSDFSMLEDYDLFVRLVALGAKFHVIPKILVRTQNGLEQRRRRRGLRYCLSEIRFRYFCFRAGFLSKTGFFLLTPVYVVLRLTGGASLDWLYFLARTPADE